MIPKGLLGRVLERLGLPEGPPPTLAGLQAVYAAWCAHVPFDNVRKMIALRTGTPPPLPGCTGEDFFEAWLATGAGGTCWPTSNALFELVHALGFDARRVAGSMLDIGLLNHGSVKVAVDGRDWLIDSSMLTNIPLPLGDEVTVRGGVFAVEVEPSGPTHVVWEFTPASRTYVPCRLLADPSSHEQYVDRYEASRASGPFNQRVYARRNRPGEMVVLAGHVRYSSTARGIDRRILTREELRAALRDDVGIGHRLIDAWEAFGGLDASFEPASEAKPPPVSGQPPSQRSQRGRA